MSVWDIPLAVAAFVTWLASPPTSMADAASHEAVRRHLMARSSGVYSNDTLPAARYAELNAPTPVAPSAGDDGGEKPAMVTRLSGPPPPEPKPADPAAEEKAWRDRVAALKKSLMDTDAQVVALESKVPLLQNQFMARDDPAQRQALGLELSKALVDLDRAKAKRQTDRAAMDKLHEDARRAGVPPGWLR